VSRNFLKVFAICKHIQMYTTMPPYSMAIYDFLKQLLSLGPKDVPRHG